MIEAFFILMKFCVDFVVSMAFVLVVMCEVDEVFDFYSLCVAVWFVCV